MPLSTKISVICSSLRFIMYLIHVAMSELNSIVLWTKTIKRACTINLDPVIFRSSSSSFASVDRGKCPLSGKYLIFAEIFFFWYNHSPLFLLRTMNCRGPPSFFREYALDMLLICMSTYHWIWNTIPIVQNNFLLSNFE